ncbi:MAG TPA: LysR family transcriptional regulator [Kofleriaceae bacterium]|nr:LysR family transcriptional regulator [Kofleriaceae bacterium]
MKTELELRHLRVFMTVVETGAHTRAARVLGLSQSTVSETLAALDRALGMPVFHKGRKGPSSLTPTGEALLPYARRILGITSELVSELATVSTQVNATLVVAAVESLSAYVLPARLAALRERWPKARLEVQTATCHEIRDSVAAGKCDLGLTLEADRGIADDSVLAEGRLVIVGAPSHPFAHRTASPRQLPHADFYTSDASGDYHQMLRHYFEVAEMPAPRTQSLGTVEGVKRGILAGGSALGLVPAHAVARELRDAVLAEIKMTPALPKLVMRAVYAQTPTSPIVDELVTSLRDSLLGP